MLYSRSSGRRLSRLCFLLLELFLSKLHEFGHGLTDLLCGIGFGKESAKALKALHDLQDFAAHTLLGDGFRKAFPQTVNVEDLPILRRLFLL